MVCDIICALLVCTAPHKMYQKGTRPPDPRYLREGLAKKEHSNVASGIGNGVMESMKHYSLYFIALLPWNGHYLEYSLSQSFWLRNRQVL